MRLLSLRVPMVAVLIVLLPKPMPPKVVVVAFPVILRFLTVLLVAGSLVPTVCPQMTALEVLVLPFVIVRLRDDVPLFEPSMVTQSAPFSTITASVPVVGVPVSEAVTPGAGLIVTVLVELAPGL